MLRNFVVIIKAAGLFVSFFQPGNRFRLFPLFSKRWIEDLEL